MRIFGPLVWATTSAVTATGRARRPACVTVCAVDEQDRRAARPRRRAATSSFSTSITSPSATLYCLPPVLTMAYIAGSTPSSLCSISRAGGDDRSRGPDARAAHRAAGRRPDYDTAGGARQNASVSRRLSRSAPAGRPAGSPRAGGAAPGPGAALGAVPPARRRRRRRWRRTASVSRTSATPHRSTPAPSLPGPGRRRVSRPVCSARPQSAGCRDGRGRRPAARRPRAPDRPVGEPAPAPFSAAAMRSLARLDMRVRLAVLVVLLARGGAMDGRDGGVGGLALLGVARSSTSSTGAAAASAPRRGGACPWPVAPRPARCRPWTGRPARRG